MNVPSLTGRTFRFIAVLPLVGAILWIAPTAAATASTCVSWTGTQPANPSSAGDSLTSVAVLSACNAWAVGTQQAGVVTQTLTEHWNGLAWTPMPSSNPGGSSHDSAFAAVAAKSSSDAWSVGSYSDGTANQTLIELLSGGIWEQVSSPDPGGAKHDNNLGAVAITSAKNAWAVGSYVGGTERRTLILRWNGVTWSHVSSPNVSATDNQLFGVTATSAKNAWAVGLNVDRHGAFQTLIEQWNGTRWKRVPSPNVGGPTALNSLQAVAAISPSDAWAVGDYFSNGREQSLIVHWNGATWKRVFSRSLDSKSVPGSLASVTELSAKDAWAVGSYSSGGDRTLAAHWNGATWSLVPSPNLGSFNELSGVAASSPADIWAVGTYNAMGPNLTLALHCC